MRAVNDAGGIFGRKMVIADCDDSGDVTRFRACFRKLVDEAKIFSFITSMTWGTGEVHGDLAGTRCRGSGAGASSPASGRTPGCSRPTCPPSPRPRPTAIWVRDILKPKTVGILYLNTPEQQLAKEALHQILDPAGIKVVREIPARDRHARRDARTCSPCGRASTPTTSSTSSWPPPMIKFIVDSSQQGYWPQAGDQRQPPHR